ncbi:OmpH family outer membrane protein [Pseudoflavitalea rhizosphaerae]|uniref:OmpH family outer membrane protein n=1 Tax=Pseudoflavitalea rhizosphaerae TaxID=1884793 RepID=UPI000F8E9DBC|nr:OmpH family outer membrane protein [Pseudoflavitalea rhizosphaerae]
MKRLFSCLLVTMVLMSVGTGSQAQTRIGYISLQELIVAMPEYKKANGDMQEHQKALQEQANDYQLEFQRKDSIFNVDSTKWTTAMREVKRKELNELYIRIVNFNQTAQQSMQKREQELLAPIQQKAVQTTQAVAKENGYAYILSKEQLIAFPAADDILPLVAKKLGLNLSAAPPSGAPGGVKKP